MGRRIVVQVFLATVLFSEIATSETVVVSLQDSSTTAASKTSSPAQVWTASYRGPRILILPGEIDIPIQTEPATLTLANGQRGRMVFSLGESRSTTRTVLADYSHPAGTVFSFRPTLFISLCGFHPEFEAAGDYGKYCDWQTKLQTEINAKVLDDYQYKHFLVDWETHYPNRTQVRDLGDVIKDFLSTRKVPWDVVIVGHSRGGIFAHDLTGELVGYNKIKNLHTYLLDPTASSTLSDIYPATKHSAYPTIHYAVNYYDGISFIYPYNNLGTIGDRDIQGYKNELYPNTDHSDLPDDWLDERFTNELVAIKDKKDADSFAADGSSGSERVKISRRAGVSFVGLVESSDGNLHVSGSLCIEGVYGCESIDATVGDDGIEVAGAAGAATAQLILREDEVYIAQSSLVQTYIASVDQEGVSVNVQDLDILDTSATVDASYDGAVYVTLTIGDSSAEVELDTVDLFFPGLSLFH